MPATAAGETSGTTLPRPRPYNPEDPLQPMFSGRESLRQYINTSFACGSLHRISLDNYLLAMETESLMILYEDSSVEVHYVDGSGLLLSPCGSEFLFEKAVPPSAHPMQPAERVRQRTQFAISLYQKQLLQALDFRNRYSNRPYLPSSIIPSERKNILFTDVSEAKWPEPNVDSRLICRHNGGVKVSSTDGHARVFLSELQEEFTVEYLCKVSQKLSAVLPLLDSSGKKSTKDQYTRFSLNSISPLSSKQPKMEAKDRVRCRNAENHRQASKFENCSSPTCEKDEVSGPFQHCLFEYCQVTQCFSVSSCPEEWKYPLSLAFMFYQLHAGNVAEPEEGSRDHKVGGLDISLERENSRTVTCLPLALPLSCEAPYFHSWNFNNFFSQRKEDIGHYSCSQPIKIVWSKGVLYKFLHGSKSVEIYPGDGSIFKSEDSFLGKYFTRNFLQKETKQREDTMYCVSSLPPDVPGTLYSVCGIITQAIRVLQRNLEALLSLTPSNSCCWKVSSEAGRREILPVLLAEKIIPNVGRLLAFSDNKVHAIFYDGMVLNTIWDFNSYCGKSQGPQDVNLGWFKLISPEGAQELLQIDRPGLYERYIRTVVEWCTSLNKDRAVCMATPQPEENWSVAAELEKIRRFSSIVLVENSNIPNKVLTVKKCPSSYTERQNSPKEILLPEKINERNVSETLEKTSKVIKDIDCLLASSAKRSVAKHTSI